MQYLGGKSRLGGRIVQAILDDLGVKRISLAVDLCSGAGGVTHRLADVSDRVIAVEAHPGLVALHKAVQGGWVPPEHVTPEEYKASFDIDWADPLAAFMGFGCAFGGLWRASYAVGNKRAAPRGFAYPASRSLVQKTRKNAEHIHADALTFDLPHGVQVVYCDPPYENTAGYVVPAAPSGSWWHRLASMNVPAYLSEYATAPPIGIEARLVWEAPVKEGTFTRGTGRVERLWRVLGFAQEWGAHLEREEAA